MRTIPFRGSRLAPWLGLLAALFVAGLTACGSGGEPSDGGVDAYGDGADAGDAGADTSGDVSAAVLHSISVEELHSRLADKDFLLINVHVPREGEIPGTDTHIAYTDIDALAAYIGALDTEAVLYCKSDAMSVSAGQALVERGYNAIYYLEGGMNAWQAAGYQLDP